MNSKKKIAIALMSIVLVIGIIGGTVAWLTATSDTIVNRFTPSNIQVDLEETTDTFQMVPGYDIAKDPVATIVTSSEECWLFVKLEKSENFDDYMVYDMADGWTQLTEDSDGNAITELIFYRQVLEADVGTGFHVLKDDKVTVLDTVTKDMMTAAETNQPTLTITAYASQLHVGDGTDFTPAQAWANI